MHSGVSVLVKDGKIAKIAPRNSFETGNASTDIDLGDATLLPGFIELHAHLTFQKVPADIVLRHGVTTVRDMGGPVHQPYGGDGSLRVLTSGQIITAPQGTRSLRWVPRIWQLPWPAKQKPGKPCVI